MGPGDLVFGPGALHGRRRRRRWKRKKKVKVKKVRKVARKPGG